ncbi:MAG: YdcF family protein [Gammaproteobacteria bacterium]|nr:YdcF family protein [Gammaproteobacteria bacterium]
MNFDPHLLVKLVLPPSGPILLGLIGAILSPWRRRAGVWVMVFSIVAAYVFSIPLTASLLTIAARPHSPLDETGLDALDADVVVVLAGGLYLRAPEYGEDTASQRTLARVRYAAFLARRLGVPVIASGGFRDKEHRWEGTRTEAEAMTSLLSKEMGIDDVLTDSDSYSTRDSARRVDGLLPAGTERILLVTDAMHSRRAVDAFLRAGIEVIPAPTRYYTAPAPYTIYSWIPQEDSVSQTWYALYELVGQVWYRLSEG